MHNFLHFHFPTSGLQYQHQRGGVHKLDTPFRQSLKEVTSSLNLKGDHIQAKTVQPPGVELQVMGTYDMIDTNTLQRSEVTDVHSVFKISFLISSIGAAGQGGGKQEAVHDLQRSSQPTRNELVEV